MEVTLLNPSFLLHPRLLPPPFPRPFPKKPRVAAQAPPPRRLPPMPFSLLRKSPRFAVLLPWCRTALGRPPVHPLKHPVVEYREHRGTKSSSVTDCFKTYWKPLRSDYLGSYPGLVFHWPRSEIHRPTAELGSSFSAKNENKASNIRLKCSPAISSRPDGVSGALPTFGMSRLWRRKNLNVDSTGAPLYSILGNVFV